MLNIRTFRRYYIMSAEALWEEFTQSGKIEDYLKYKNKDKTNDNTGRNSFKGTSCG